MTSPVTLTKTPKWADIEITGNVPTSEVTKMTIDSTGGAHLMSLLTDLYSDPELAVLREYTSNAIDSHRSVGQTAPIEVHLPSALIPNFIVQDYGTGMSKDDIKYIYSSYGASTKRDDLKQIGAFGLGCKSALTLTQQFTVESVKDKKRTVAHILRGSDGVGEVSIISHKEVDKPNGVKITIPVPNHNTFASKAANFFNTWRSEDVLVDGKTPSTMFDTEHVSFKPSNGEVAQAYMLRPATRRGWSDKWNKGLYVIIGGISYPVDLGLDLVRNTLDSPLRSFTEQTVVMLEAPIGSVDLVPSREALRYSPRTVKNLGIMTKRVMDDIYALVRADVNDAPDRMSALGRRNFWQGLRGKFYDMDYTWGGILIPKELSIQDVAVNSFNYSSRSNAGYTHRTDYFAGPKAPARLHLNNLADSTVPRYYAVDKRKPGEIRAYTTMFRDYLRKNRVELQHAILYHLDTEPTDPWFLAAFKRVSIDTMLAVAKQFRADERATITKVPATPRDTVKYPLVTITATGDVTFDTDTVATDIPAGTLTLDMTSNGPNIEDKFEKFLKNRGSLYYRYDSENYKTIKAILKQMFPTGGTFVLIEGGRKVDALKNRTANVVDTNFMVEFKKAALALLNQDGIESSAVREVLDVYFSDRIRPRDFAGGLKNVVGSIDDPEIVDLVTRLTHSAKIDENMTAYLRKIVSFSSDRQQIDDAAKVLKKRIIAVLDKYPLLGVLSSNVHKQSAMLSDLVEYLNYSYGKVNNV